MGTLSMVSVGRSSSVEDFEPTAADLFHADSPLGFAGGSTNLTKYCGNAPTMFVDPNGREPTDDPREHDPEAANLNVHESVGHLQIFFEGHWSSRDRTRVLDSINRIRAKLPPLVQALEKELDRLSPCEAKHLRRWLVEFRGTLGKMLSMFEYDGFELHFRHGRRGEEGPFADSWVENMYYFHTIRFNDQGKRNWRTFDDRFFDAILFHEILHIMNRDIIDTDENGPLQNAHTIQGLINSNFDRFMAYLHEKRKANDKCGQEY